MPTSNNNSSPVKRPGLGRRAISSHAVVTRATSNTGDPSDVQANNTPQAPRPHRPPRAHVVGGAHRSHARNPSFGKNLNKIQRFTAAYLGTDQHVRQHQRKKSAPPTPVDNHVHWDSVFDNNDTTASMKRNYSSPALRRNTSGVVAKKALADRPRTSSGKKKTVGFELADSDNEWEDTTQSPESTRRSSVAQGKDSVENTTVLVDPLTFVKRSFPQVPRAASLPEPTSFPPDGPVSNKEAEKQHTEEQQEQHEQQEPNKEPGDIAARLLSPSHSSKAPPAMSSISATAKPTALDSLSRNVSLSNLAASQNSPRRTPSSSTGLANTPGTQPGTSSSMEGGVSKFIVNRPGMNPSRTDSDPNTPSSFLPHYHPQTPPSPNHVPGSRRARSPPSRPQGTEPASRTQQKLWLQRTAALNTTPPDPHGVSAVSPSAMDPAFMAAAHSRPGQYDTGRSLMMNGGPRVGGAVHGNEAKHIRKAYEKTALELTVVRRFQSPTGHSFNRLSLLLNEFKAPTRPSSQGRPSSLGKPVKSAPALTLLRDGRQSSSDQGGSSPDHRELMGRRTDAKNAAPQAYLHASEDQDLGADSTTELPHRFKSQHPDHRILSTSAETPHTQVPDEDTEDTYYPSETDMMIRRMWESREVATPD